MAEERVTPILDYRPPDGQQRGRWWKIALGIVSPWLFEAIVTAACYLPRPNGERFLGPALTFGLIGGPAFTSFMVARYGEPKWAMVLLAIFAFPAQVLFVLSISYGVKSACGVFPD